MGNTSEQMISTKCCSPESSLLMCEGNHIPSWKQLASGDHQPFRSNYATCWGDVSFHRPPLKLLAPVPRQQMAEWAKDWRTTVSRGSSLSKISLEIGKSLDINMVISHGKTGSPLYSMMFDWITVFNHMSLFASDVMVWIYVFWRSKMVKNGQTWSKFSQNLSFPGISHYGWNYVKNTYFITAFYALLRQFYAPLRVAILVRIFYV
jgi:hypothetical protein